MPSSIPDTKTALPACIADSIPSDALTYDTDDLRRILRVGARTIWRWSNSGIMPKPSKVGGRVLWPAETIRQWVSGGMPRCDGRDKP